MSNNKQSSVEWLAEIIRFANKELYAEMFEKIEQAKAMHKEEIREALIDGAINSTLIEYRIPHYYEQTFGE